MSALQQQAFRLAAAELGMASASWLFVRESGAVSDAAVSTLRDELGRAWPVLDAVCAAWLAGHREPAVDAGEVLPSLAGLTRLVLVGHEADWVDALLRDLPPAVRVGLLQLGDPHVDWQRVLANHGGRMQALSLQDFQAWAGPRSALLTFVYGTSDTQVFVLPSWLRVAGPDVRLQFRHLLGWHILDVPLEVYPRWLVAVDAQTLTERHPAR